MESATFGFVTFGGGREHLRHDQWTSHKCLNVCHSRYQVEVASIIIDFFASGAPVVAEGVEMHKLVLPCTWLSFPPPSYQLDCRDTAVHPGDSETVRCS